jgi:phytoene synthase
MSPRPDLRAIELAEAVISARSRSFALASRLLPRGARARAVVLYAWCRRADDAVDLAADADRAAAVARLAAELDAVARGVPPDDVVVRGFAALVRTSAIPLAYPAELIAGMGMDAAGVGYASIDDLVHYCYRVAGTVGLMMSHVLGVADDGALEPAAHLGIAMQLTNVCRDVAEDWALGRLYLPDALLRVHGAGELRAALGGPLPGSARAPLAHAVASILALAERYYASADRGLAALGAREAFAVRTALNLYRAIGHLVRERGCDVLAPRAVVPPLGKLAEVARAARDAAVDLPGRAARAARPRPRPRPPARTVSWAAELVLRAEGAR